MLFGDRTAHQLIVMAVPPDEALFDLAAEHAPKAK